MVVEYNDDMRFVLYQNNEIEIVEETLNKNSRLDKKWHFYFRSVYDLAEAIKKSPELAKQLKELL
ncbi:MAG: hypothetical protein ACFFDF_22585 [Candidatus Odinarchaeota archaeon]